MGSDWNIIQAERSRDYPSEEDWNGKRRSSSKEASHAGWVNSVNKCFPSNSSSAWCLKRSIRCWGHSTTWSMESTWRCNQLCHIRKGVEPHRLMFFRLQCVRLESGFWKSRLTRSWKPCISPWRYPWRRTTSFQEQLEDSHWQIDAFQRGIEGSCRNPGRSWLNEI